MSFKLQLSFAALVISLHVCNAQTVVNDVFLYEKSVAMTSPDRLNRKDTVKIVILGDIMMHRAQIENAGRNGKYSFDEYFSHIGEDIRSADIAVANMEFSLGGKPYTGYPSFSAPDEYADAVAGAGIDVFLTANNHILDKGKHGIERTVGIYESMEGIRHTGTSMNDRSIRPLFMNRKGIRISFINVTYGTNTRINDSIPYVYMMADTALLSGALRRSEKEADVTIVLPHWGTEYNNRHSYSQEKFAGWLVGKGADAIVGSHPHVVQDSCMFSHEGKSVPVIYSVGNAISNMSAGNTRIGLMVTITVISDKVMHEVLKPEFTYLWVSLPGRFCDSHTIIPVESFMNRKSLWNDSSDYYKMIDTYNQVLELTGETRHEYL